MEPIAPAPRIANSNFCMRSILRGRRSKLPTGIDDWGELCRSNDSRREFLKQSAALTALSAATWWRPGAAQELPLRRSRDDVRPRPRRGRRRHQDVQGHSLRREHGGHEPLHAAGRLRRSGPACATRSRTGRARRSASRARRARTSALAVAAAGLPRRERRLPGAQRLDAGGRRRPQAAGDVLVPRRRVRRRAPARRPSPTARTSRAAATWWSSRSTTA